MHELSVCIALLDEVERIAREHRARTVAAIVVKVGPLSGIDAAQLRQAYPLAAAGTVAEDAELLIRVADVVVSCGECGSESSAPPNRLLCAACGGFRTRVVSGDDMILERVELETLRAPAPEQSSRTEFDDSAGVAAPAANPTR